METVKMDDLIKEIGLTYKLISSIPVTNDAIDISATARAKLRRVEAALIEMKRNEKAEVTE